MKVTFLSTGWALPTPERSGTAVLLGGEETVMLDCGGDAAQKMLKAGAPLESLDRVLLSHGHPDHASGLLGLLHANKFVDREKPLRVEGPRHAVDRVRSLVDLFEVEPDYPLETGVLEPGDAADPLTCVEADHSVPALSYRYGDVAFTGDTAPTDDLVDLAADADLLIAEATSPDPERARRYRHLSPELAGDIAKKAGVGTLAIIHTHPTMGEAEVAGNVGFDGHLLTPRDLDTYEGA